MRGNDFPLRENIRVENVRGNVTEVIAGNTASQKDVPDGLVTDD